MPTFCEHGLPGYQPFLLQDGIFSTRSGETEYCYQCMTRIVHPFSATQCYNKLPVVLRPPRGLISSPHFNFSDIHTYFLDLDSQLLSPIASEVPCPSLFPATYCAHQGWILVTLSVLQVPMPEPLPVLPPRQTCLPRFSLSKCCTRSTG